MPDLMVIVPSRGRPESVQRVTEAWRTTGAYDDGARLVFAIDADDPRRAGYYEGELPDIGVTQAYFVVLPEWKPMVAKLNECAVRAAGAGGWGALAFAGDDHLARTPGWARHYLDALADLGSGIVYGNDLIQGERLPTQWAMTSDIVRELGRMVPALVEHMYCDNAVLALGQAAGCIRYLPDVVIEHVHPVAGRAEWDAQYRRVNAPERYRFDGDAYRRWVSEQLDRDAAIVRALREGVPVGG